MRIVIPGGSGEVGTILARTFHKQGHAVTVTARHPRPAPWNVVPWDGKTLDSEVVDGEDLVINLAGRSVNCRYTAANRRKILESRVDATRAVGLAIARAAHPPALWMNAATATIYRHALDRPMDEASGELGGNEPGAPDTWNFSIDVAKAWESAFFEAPVPRTRRIALRSAMVMSPDPGGVFDVLLGLVRVRLGGAAGSGRQFVSWIHDADFVRAVQFLIVNSHLEGAINICAPTPLPNHEFMRALRDAYGIRIGLAAPEWLLEFGAVFLRTETELILKSRRVVPGRLLDAGFTFDFPEWPAAARDLVGRWHPR